MPQRRHFAWCGGKELVGQPVRAGFALLCLGAPELERGEVRYDRHFALAHVMGCAPVVSLQELVLAHDVCTLDRAEVLQLGVRCLAKVRSEASVRQFDAVGGVEVASAPASGPGMHRLEQAPRLPRLAFAGHPGDAGDAFFKPVPPGVAALMLDAAQQGFPVHREHGLVQPEAGDVLLLRVDGAGS
eukprot:4650956-Lingulodinium_polyedra.AAC.1